MGAVSLALDAGVTVLVESLVTTDNVAELVNLVRDVEARGVRDISFMPYVSYDPKNPRRSVSLREIEKLILDCKTAVGGTVRYHVPCAPRHCLESEPVSIVSPVAWEFDNHCAAGVLWMSVSYDGMLRHCPHSNVFAGAVEDGIRRVWQERILPTIRQVLRPDTPACSTCGQFRECGGGCHLHKVTGYEGAEVGRRPGLVSLL